MRFPDDEKNKRANKNTKEKEKKEGSMKKSKNSRGIECEGSGILFWDGKNLLSHKWCECNIGKDCGKDDDHFW